MARYTLLFNIIFLFGCVAAACSTPTQESFLPTSSPIRASGLASPLPTAVPSRPGLLPGSLYFLSQAEQGTMQIWKIAADGVSQEQVTSEPESITDFDISPATGVLANQPASPGGDGNQTTAATSYSPYAWSPDGSRLLIEITKGEIGSTLGVVTLSTGNLITLLGSSEGNPLRLACCEASWSPDSSKIYLLRQKFCSPWSFLRRIPLASEGC